MIYNIFFSWKHGLVFVLFAIFSAAAVNVEVDAGGNIKTLTERRLQPEDVRGVEPFMKYENTTMQLANGSEVVVAHGEVEHPRLGKGAKFIVIPRIMGGDLVKKARKIIHTLPFDKFDKSSDSSDAMPRQEFYVHQGDEDMDGIRGQREEGNQATDPAQINVRRKLKKLLAPIEELITVAIRKNWPDQCDKSKDRQCRACFSFIRRYKKDERRSHMMHRDGHAIVTSVVSLSEYDREYRGGLYVSSAVGQPRQALRLNRGDVVIHTFELLHGVEMQGGEESFLDERLSWVMWWKDSATCQEYGHTWSKSCAERGDPLCQYNYGWRMALNAEVSPEEKNEQRFRWMTKAAENGVSEAMFMIARSHFGMQNITGARSWLEKSMEYGDPDAAYQIGHLLLKGIFEPTPSELESAKQTLKEKGPDERKDEERVALERVALEYIERAAVAGSSGFRGSPFAMYNLGVAWFWGFAGLEKNVPMALQWFNQCGLPEGLMAMSVIFKNNGYEQQASHYEERANRTGFGSARPQHRDQMWFELHSEWPEGPPRW